MDISDSSLSKHLGTLAGAGYVTIRKTTGRSRTWISLTSLGRRTYNEHLSALRSLVDLQSSSVATE
jgi:DNA-binding MarR family transcriptional regulator